jgi:hypothetical protein
MVAIDGKQAFADKMPQVFKVDGRFDVSTVVFLQNVLDESGVGSESGRDDSSDEEAIGMAILGNIAGDDRQWITQESERTEQGF